MASSTTVTLRYVGPHAEVEVEVAPGRWQTVARGEEARFGRKLAPLLLEQETWEACSKIDQSSTAGDPGGK